MSAIGDRMRDMMAEASLPKSQANKLRLTSMLYDLAALVQESQSIELDAFEVLPHELRQVVLLGVIGTCLETVMGPK
jgi:hypothetical protein